MSNKSDSKISFINTSENNTNNEKKRVVTFEQSFGNCLLNIKNSKLFK